MRTRPGIPTLLVLSALTGCDRAAETLPPLGEALVVVDTDAPVPRLVGRLRVDLYADDGAWLDSRDIALRQPSDWPASFSVYDPSEKAARRVLVRLRGYPANKERDYRGERYAERPSGGKLGDLVTLPAPTDEPRLLRSGEDVTPPSEPLPNLAIDRLVSLYLVPGKRGSLQIVLRGACFGTMADLADQTTCVDTENARVPIEDEHLDPDLSRRPPSLAGSFGAPEPCAAEPRQPGVSTDGVPLHDEEVCVPGGAFILGSPEGEGLGPLDGTPERVAVIPSLLVDRYEVTVARWRAALAAGFHPPEGAIPNDGPLATSSGAPGATWCTWSTKPLAGADNREQYPMACVSWNGARAFCQSLGGDLPTEAEWEYVAGASGRDADTRFPWGQDPPSCANEVYARLDQKSTNASECFDDGARFGAQPVTEGSAGDVTPELGIVGLGGSMVEWVRDAYYGYDTVCWASTPLVDPRCVDDASETRMSRGGGWGTSAVDMVAALRGLSRKKGSGFPGTGFRCVRGVAAQ